MATRVAAIYDVHGNLPALEAVLDAARRADADLLVFGGDYAWGPMPAPVVRRIRELERSGRALAIRGNADREVAARLGEADGLDPATAASNLWAANQLTAAERDWLAGLPETVMVDVENRGSVLFCHGSPRSDAEAVVDTTADTQLKLMLEGQTADTIVLGHTHLQFGREFEHRTILNAGSVGLPFGAPGAYWALIDRGIHPQRADYDYAAAGRAFVQMAGPNAAAFAEHVRTPPDAELARQIYA